MATVIPGGKERRWWPGHAYCALAIYLISLLFPNPSPPIPLVGLLAFVQALETLVRSIMSPGSALAGNWLLGLSWLANPAAWAAMVFLHVGRTRLAVLSGALALLLASCALRPHIFCQYVWLASMVYVVCAALRVRDNVSGADNLIDDKYQPTGN